MASRIVPEGGWQSRLKPSKTPAVKKPNHLRFIKQLPCICCAVKGNDVPADDPMHLRSQSDLHGHPYIGKGQKPDDRWVLPGCRPHHDQQHAHGSEMDFWQMHGIDAHLLALVLWGLSGDDFAARQAIAAHVQAAKWGMAIARNREMNEA